MIINLKKKDLITKNLQLKRKIINNCWLINHLDIKNKILNQGQHGNVNADLIIIINLRNIVINVNYIKCILENAEVRVVKDVKEIMEKHVFVLFLLN